MAGKKGRKGDINFSMMLQNKGLTQLGKLDSSDFAKNFNPDLAKSIIQSGDISIELSMASLLPFRAQTHKVLDYALILFTNKNDYNNSTPDCDVRFTLDEFLAMTNTPITKATRDYLRKKMRTDLDIIYGLSLEIDSPDTEDLIIKERIISSYSIVNSEVRISFNPTFAKQLTHSYFIDLPVKLFAVPESNQAAYYLGKKLAEHSTYNLNKSRGTADIISVKSLLASCPVLPEKEEVKYSKYKEKIQIPFTKALDSLVEDNIITYEFCNAKKVPLTEAQKTRFNFSTFQNSYVHFNLLKEQNY